MAVFKIKALVNYGKFIKGMEVEILIKGSSRKPTGSEIKNAFDSKYGIVAPNMSYGKPYFEVIEN